MDPQSSLDWREEASSYTERWADTHTYVYLFIYKKVALSVTTCHLSGTLGGTSLLTNQKAKSHSTHSTRLGIQWADANHIPGNTASENNQYWKTCHWF